ncbi:peptidase C14 [Dentipellis sp. KUC8613]|nr:peptidase C14 [Dentipellis sp. KUC8613]
MQHPLFAYSRCTGRRRGVCIGINYTGSRNELKGCVNDATNVWHFIVDNYHYPRDQVLFITDSTNEPRARPTRKNILRAMKWLVEGAQSDDALFFHYSGHGGQTKDRDGDEVDGYDEVIFPEDYQTAGVITDDDMHDIMVKPLPPGCRLTAVFDVCSSVTIPYLPYLYGYNGRVKGSQVSARFKSIKTTPADVITWSGCKDSQTSADTYKDGVAVGAMSYVGSMYLQRNPNISYQDLLRGVRDILKKKYSQTPQMSSSHHIVSSSP